MKYIISVCIVVVVGLFTYFIYANKKIEITNYEFYQKEILEDIRIVHLSDIHNDLLGKENKDLVEKVKKAQPEIIFITGDLIDSRRTNINRALALVKELVEIAPIYYVSGNHEARIKQYDEFERELKELKVCVLNNDHVDLNQLRIYGLQDPGFYNTNKYYAGGAAQEMLDKMNIIKDSQHINILLTHRPHYFKDIYCKYQLDYIFAGHAHGGQMRLPIIGGLYAPGQGILPKYDSGIYKENSVIMILSRGLGNSLFPLRIFNNPEIIVVEIKRP